MRRFRFFTERTNIRPGSSVKLPDFESQHARKALRLKNGDEVYIFNGEKEFKCVVRRITNDLLMVNVIEEFNAIDFSEKVDFYLFQALTKKNSFEMIAEKSTELGVDFLIPFQSEYSVIDKDKISGKLERWNKIMIQAAKQSERMEVPKLESPTDFEGAINYAKENDLDQVYFFIVPSQAKKEDSVINIKDLVKSQLEKSTDLKKIGLFIGPEGGFSLFEVQKAKEAGFQFVTLFDTVLRAETASIVAMAMMRLMY